MYQARVGCQWRHLPHDFPPYTAVYYYFYFGLWRDDATDQTIHDLLRWQVRESKGRGEDPSAVVMDSQTVHVSLNAPKKTTGLDPGKRNRGRKRGIATDGSVCSSPSSWSPRACTTTPSGSRCWTRWPPTTSEW
ncbi:hypothetical protein AB0I94_32215 [Streptomyces sp. NPDC050147]|uniref:hypothetical protein n=1 Tax=Streptomyces sp. NPDC050147 TaxID=3155513 RepID=UPI00344A781D